MIYLTGDTHGEIDIEKLTSKQKSEFLKEGDYLIVTGDFGFPFSPNDIEMFEKHNGTAGKYSYRMNWFSQLPYTVLFIDGNHDNHDWWSKQEVTEMFGGRVQIHPHSPNVIHLLRGEVYTIEEKTFFTFGGAASVDKAWRIEGVSWWKGEEANIEETENAFNNLEKINNKVDYIITHTMPFSLIPKIPVFGDKLSPYPCATAKFLDTILANVSYKRWYCGHFHVDDIIKKERISILYNNIISLEEYN